MNKKPARSSSTKCWSAQTAIGFGEKAVHEEKPRTRNARQRSTSNWTDSLSCVETVADSNVTGGSQKFYSDREMEELTAKTKSENEQFREMMDRCIARWDNGKNIKVAERRSEALEETANSKLDDYAILSEHDFSDEDSFDSDDENKFECIDVDVLNQNICERHINSESFDSTAKNGLTVGKQSSKCFIASEYITPGPCMPYFGKLIDVGETSMPHFNFAQKGNPATATEDIRCENLIDNSSRQGITSIGSQDTGQLSLTRTSSEDSCEKIQANFINLPADDAYRKAKKVVKTPLQRQTRMDFQKSAEEKLTTPVKLAENFFARIWKENAIGETDKKENADSNVPATVGGSGDTIQEGGIVFGTLRQHLAPPTLKKAENQSYDAEIEVDDESVFENVFDHSSAEELVMLDVSVEGQNRSGFGSHDVVCGLVQMKLEEPGNSERKILLKDGNKITAGRVRESCLDNGDKNWLLAIDRKRDSSLNWEPQLLGSDEKNLEANFSRAGSDRILQKKTNCTKRD